MNKRAAFTSFIGNALEFYDFALYGAFAGLFTKLFFPPAQFAGSIFLSGLGVFSIGLIARPLGGLIFGYIGDHYGRRLALSMSMYLMTIPSMMIMLLPTYDSIGTLAPTLLIIARLIQGFCTGGEYNGAAIFALEHQPEASKGLVSGMMTASSATGLVLSSFVAYIVTSSNLPDWGWRIAFMIGGCIALFGYYVRRKNLESPEFQNSLQQKSIFKFPIKEAFRSHKTQMLATAIVAGQTSVLAYMIFTLINNNSALSSLNIFSRSEIYSLNLMGISMFALMCIVSGHMSHKLLKDVSNALIGAAIIAILLIIPIFYLIDSQNYWMVLIGVALFGMLAGLHAGPQHLYMQTLFPNTIRYSAVAFSFSLGTGVLGGIMPPISQTLIRDLGSPALLVVFTSTLVCITLFYTQRVQLALNATLRNKRSNVI